MPDLYWNTIEPTLRFILADIMAEPLFDPFRLVGRTALSLQLGHRISVDIDLFTDATYGSIDIDAIDTYFRQHYPYVSDPTAGPVAFGRSYFVGEDPQHAAKVDIYYTDPFNYSVDQMFALHGERYPYAHEEQALRNKFTDFAQADDDLDPICIRGKYWEIIKLDLMATV